MKWLDAWHARRTQARPEPSPTLLLETHIPFDALPCARCGVVFAVPHDLHAHWRADGTTFYCPNGHAQSYRSPAPPRATAAIYESTTTH